MQINSPRIDKVSKEIVSLDKEIQNISEELDNNFVQLEPASNKNALEGISQPSPVQSGDFNIQKSKHIHSDNKSLSIDSTNSSTESDSTNDLILTPPKNKIKIINYKPLSERIQESQTKRNDFIQKSKEEQEAKFKKEYTFKPVLVSHYQTPTKAIPRREPKQVHSDQPKKQKKYINKVSEKIISNSTKKHSLFAAEAYRPPPPERWSSHRISEAQLATTFLRLSTPKKQVSDDDEEPTPKRYADYSVINRLADESVELMRKRGTKPIAETPKKKSKQMKKEDKTRDRSCELFKQSVQLMQSRYEASKIHKEFIEMQEMEECSFHPKISHKKISHVQTKSDIDDTYRSIVKTAIQKRLPPNRKKENRENRKDSPNLNTPDIDKILFEAESMIDASF